MTLMELLETNFPTGCYLFVKALSGQRMFHYSNYNSVPEWIPLTANLRADSIVTVACAAVAHFLNQARYFKARAKTADSETERSTFKARKREAIHSMKAWLTLVAEV